MRNQMAWGEVRRVQSGPGYETAHDDAAPGNDAAMAENPRVHRMVTVTTGSGLLKTGTQTRPVRVGDNFEVAAGDSAVIYCGPEAEMQLVEVVCDVAVEVADAPVTLQLVHS